VILTPERSTTCRVLEGVRAANQLVRLERKLALQRSLIPDPVRHEMVQPVVIARRDPLGHRADALAIARADRPRHIEDSNDLKTGREKFRVMDKSEGERPVALAVENPAAFHKLAFD
jgi:hypothetical protein